MFPGCLSVVNSTRCRCGISQRRGGRWNFQRAIAGKCSEGIWNQGLGPGVGKSGGGVGECGRRGGARVAEGERGQLGGGRFGGWMRPAGVADGGGGGIAERSQLGAGWLGGWMRRPGVADGGGGGIAERSQLGAGWFGGWMRPAGGADCGGGVAETKPIESGAVRRLDETAGVADGGGGGIAERSQLVSGVVRGLDETGGRCGLRRRGCGNEANWERGGSGLDETGEPAGVADCGSGGIAERSQLRAEWLGGWVGPGDRWALVAGGAPAVAVPGERRPVAVWLWPRAERSRFTEGSQFRVGWWRWWSRGFLNGCGGPARRRLTKLPNEPIFAGTI